jgi:methylated-DNA-[protein]-cysteine S-methyltransferase
LQGRAAPEAEPPPHAAAAITGVQALFAGEAPDLSTIPLDLSGVGAFERQVYAALRQVPPGETVTYGELARRIGRPGAAQAVGRAMARNPFAPVVPCHRVLAAGGRVGGFSAGEGVSTKVRLLEMERKADRGLFPDLPLATYPPRPQARRDAAGV